MSPGVEQALRQRLTAAGVDVDAANLILRAARKPDLPVSLADLWATGWDGRPLLDLVARSPADRQHFLVLHIDGFVQHPAHLPLRVTFAAAHPTDADLRAAGQLATDLHDLLTAFNRDVREARVSSFTGKVLYKTLTDVDVETTKAFVEVTTQPDAAGKVSQLAKLLRVIANPLALPVFHYTPNVGPVSAPARALRAAGSAGVYNDRAALVAAIRALP